MATIVVEDLSPIKKRATFEVPEETVRDAIESQYMDIKKNAQIKGFRKGKAPLQIIKRYFRGKVEGEVLQKIIEDTLEPGLEEENIKPLSVLSIDPGTLETGKPFRFSAEVEVAPPITPTNYKGMKLEKLKVTVSEEMVEEQLQRIRNANAKLVPTPENRGAQTGDYLIIDVKAGVEGEPIPELTVDDYHLEMGRDFYLPGFDVHLNGIKIDESKNITVDFPDDFANKKLAGKKGAFEILCKEIKERIVPELDDEFARDLGTHDSLAELKDEVRRGLEQELKSARGGHLRDQIMQQLLENHDFEVPKSLVEQKLSFMIDGFLRAYAKQGVDPRKLVQSGALPRDELRPAALKEAKLSLILKAIADQEVIDATEEELDQEYDLIAKQFEMAPDEARQLVQARKGLALVRGGIIERKTYRFLEENAVLIESSDSSNKGQSEAATETA